MVSYELYFYRKELYSSGRNTYLAYKSNEPDGLPIFDLKYKIEVNKTGSCSFIVSVKHPHYDKVEEMNTFVSVVVRYRKNGVLKQSYCPFVGRVLEIKEDQIGNKEVTCEGVLSTLNETFERTNYVIGAQNYRTTVYAGAAIGSIFDEHDSYHSTGYYDYSGIYNGYDNGTRGLIRKASEHPSNVENMSRVEDTGSLISDYSNSDDAYKDDKSVKSMYDLLFNTVLKKSGGFILPVYDPFSGAQQNVFSPLCLWTYYESDRVSGYYSNYHALVHYPNENPSAIEFDRTDWLPHFTKGYNVINLSKESSLKTKFNAIYPVGKDDISIEGYAIGHASYFIISVGSGNSPYEDLVPITLSFPDIADKDDLRSAAQAWANTHARDSSIPKKYTITGPEPCGVGCGEVLIMLMRDVIIREDPSEDLLNCLVLPCLSMEIDVQNPQNNTYVVGPFIDDTYAETTISSK